jgi:hypothetical protein
MPFSFRKTALELGTSVITNTISNAILGKSGRGGSSDFADLNNLSQGLGKLGMKNLRYPLDVEAAPGMGNQGHYIMFFINEQTRSELEVGRGTGYRGSTGTGDHGYSSGTSGNYDYTTKRKIQGFGSSSAQVAAATKNADQQIVDLNKNSTNIRTEFQNDNLNNIPAGAGESTVFVKRRATKRLNTAISMYMPTGVKATYGANYQDSSIGQGARFAADLYSDVMGGRKASDAVLDTLANDFPQAVREAAILAALKLAENVPGFQGATDVLGMATGEVVAERLELAFRNINKRKFQYTFKMLPKSREEVDMVHEIVLAFKKHMSASFKDGNRSGKTLVVPDTFNIEYMYNGGKNQYLHQISECVLETVDVSYGGDRYKTFAGVDGKGAPPVETTLSLNFAELELISRERIEEGF